MGLGTIAAVTFTFLWWVIAPFVRQDKGATPTVIHNNIHIINNSAPSHTEPKQTSTSEEGLFGRIKF